MATPSSARRDRIPAGLAAVGLNLLIGYALVRGLGVDLTRRAEETLAVFDVPIPAPPRRPEPAPPASRAVEREGRAAPANLRATPTAVVAPVPVVQPPPPPVPAAPVAAEGDAPSAGATELPGPGPGAGGAGDGSGAGGGGDGTGGGLGRGTPSRQIAGRIRDRDYPAAARRTGAQGSVIVHLHIDPRGRVARCEVARSSGHPELDGGTCRLIGARFRYEPARDAAGRPIADLRAWKQDWWIDPRAAPAPR